MKLKPKFKVKDKVMVIYLPETDVRTYGRFLGKIGKVASIEMNTRTKKKFLEYEVLFDKMKKGSGYLFLEKELILVKNEKTAKILYGK